jgi:hypothetical protein
MLITPRSWILKWGKELLTAEDLSWLDAQVKSIHDAPTLYFSTFSLCARRFDQECPATVKPNMDPKGPEPVSQIWQPSNWSHCTLARAMIIAQLKLDWRTFDSTFSTADLKENMDLYRLLCLFIDDDNSTSLCARLGEGLRTNTVPIFIACAFHSHLPASLLPEEAWNQMILKALFLDLDPSSVVDQNRRQNDALDFMLLRYASEKAYASREIPDHLWNLMQSALGSKTKNSIQKLIVEHPNTAFNHFLKIRFTGP